MGKSVMRYRSDMLVDDGLDGGHRLIFQSLELIMFSIAVSFAHFAHQIIMVPVGTLNRTYLIFTCLRL